MMPSQVAGLKARSTAQSPTALADLGHHLQRVGEQQRDRDEREPDAAQPGHEAAAPEGEPGVDAAQEREGERQCPPGRVVHVPSVVSGSKRPEAAPVRPTPPPVAAARVGPATEQARGRAAGA